MTWLLTRLLHGLRPGWLASVPRIRWRWLKSAPGSPWSRWSLVPRWCRRRRTAPRWVAQRLHLDHADFLVVVVLLTPCRRRGGVRLPRLPGPGVRQPLRLLVRTAGRGGPGAALRRGARSQSPPVFLDRFAFGLVAGLLVVLTGPRGRHRHARAQQLARLRPRARVRRHGVDAEPGRRSWWTIPVTLTQSLTYLALVLLVARRWRLRTSTGRLQGRGVLAAPRPSRVVFSTVPTASAGGHNRNDSGIWCNWQHD